MRIAGLLFLAVTALGGQDRLTLDEAERIALQQHPRIRAAQFLTAASRAQVQQVKGTLQPFLSGNVTASAADHTSRIGAGGLNASSLFSRFGSGLAVGQTLFDFGRTARLAESISSRADAQQATQSTVRSQVLLEVRQAYYRVLELQRSLDLSRSALTSRQLLRRQIQALVENQLRSTLDLQFAELAVSEAEVAVARFEGELQSAAAVLATALGFTEDRQFVLADSAEFPELGGSADSLVKEALASRPDLASRRLQHTAAKEFAESEKRLVLPSVTATGVFGFIPAGDPRLRTRYGGLGLNLNVPVFNGRTFAARRQEADARAGAAEQDARELELRAAREVRTAFSDAMNAYRRIALSDKQVAQARRLYLMADTRYKAGLGTIVELNQAELAQLSAELNAANTRYAYLTARSVLDFAVGRLK